MTRALGARRLAASLAAVSTGARDRSGNLLATARTWSFTVDVTRPTTKTVTPINGATNVATFATVAVTFSEPIGRAGNRASCSP